MRAVTSLHPIRSAVSPINRARLLVVREGGEDHAPSSPPPPPPPGPPPPSAVRHLGHVELDEVDEDGPRFVSPERARLENQHAPATPYVTADWSRLAEAEDNSEDDEADKLNGPNTVNEEEEEEKVPSPPPASVRPQDQPTVVDRAMEFAVQKLAKIIHARGHNSLLDKSEDTRRLLDDISQHVSRLVDDEDKLGEAQDLESSWDNDAADGENVEEQEESLWKERERTNTTESRSHYTRESERPTPYDLWSRRKEMTERKETPKNKVRLTEEQFNSVVERLYASLERHNISVAETQRAIITKEMMETPFTPRINARSRTLASKEISIVERTAIIEERRARRLRQERERLAEKEGENATFQPKINEHSRILAANTGSRLFDSPKKRHEQLAQQIQQERLAAEDAELTFSPQINRRSREMATKGKALALAFSPVTKRSPSPTKHRRPEETFTPAINPASRRMASGLSSGKSVHERLYDESIQSARKARERLAQESAPDSVRPGSARSKLAVVKYRPDLDFIFETLGREAQ